MPELMSIGYFIFSETLPAANKPNPVGGCLPWSGSWNRQIGFNPYRHHRHGGFNRKGEASCVDSGEVQIWARSMCTALLISRNDAIISF